MPALPPTPSTQSRIVLVNRPKAAISPDISSGKGTFLLEKSAPVDKELGKGECLIRTEWVSLDPAMRGWLNATRSYIAPVEINAVMRAGGVGRLVALATDAETTALAQKKGLQVGDWVSTLTGWQEYAKVGLKEVQKIQVSDKISPSYYLGALGMPGQTAYWGLTDVCDIKSGETVVVTGAAGAVGSVACQIAKIKGCRVIAVAGGADKCRWLKEELGVDAALDYKSKDFKKEFRETVGYFDAMFDNVGGEILDFALTRMKKFARIALCGAISAYNDPAPRGLQAYLNLISQCAKIQGFIVFDYAKRYKEADAELASFVNSGQLKIREHRLTGIENCVEGLLGLFEGVNTGKIVVKIGSGETKL
ncbi:hypothetical protein BCR35DRAFT_277574 [Leucosporidium creatinivorum]|uniref:Enoyl reductase (ER) domain-containing protein n=1 Tax=Leucosporidium creatinivorum TaxID=106004 RepID=A0A1Y2FRU9_9BASI|nr:hypothetical protein BCR35DRAFT_277574 [Leucosporidium creatinivorum]